MNQPPESQNPYSNDSPQVTQHFPQGPQVAQAATSDGDGTGGVIPYKNPSALFAYYLGIFSLLPLIGFVLGIAAFILGIIGLKKRRENPAIKGSVHAWIGIVLGGLCACGWGLAFVGIILAMFAG